MKFLRLFLLFALLGCGKAKPSVPVPARKTPPAVATPDPLLGTVDKLEVRLSHVRDRLAGLDPTMNADDAALKAILLAAEDQLALREMAVLKQGPLPGERPWAAADRFATQVWRGQPNCDPDPGEVKLLYLQQLARFKHPARFAIWEAQLQCCADLGKCPPDALVACRSETLPQMQALATQIQAREQRLPPLGLAADVTDVDLAHSPIQGPRTDAFELAVADANAREPRLQLRRYDFYRQGEPGMAAGHFRPGEPNVSRWAEKARLGDVSQPIETLWGWSVVLLAAREPTRTGKTDPVVIAQLRQVACQELAVRQRQNWRDGLLRAAQVRWDRHEIEANFGKAVSLRVPQNTPRFSNPR